jgi:hypothetical protein
LLVPLWFRWILRERCVSRQHSVDDPAAEVLGVGEQVLTVTSGIGIR